MARRLYTPYSDIRTLEAEPVDTEYLQSIVAPKRVAPPPVAAPAPAAPFNPVGFDWFNQGLQNIGGTIYQPQYSGATGSMEQGDWLPGELQGVMRYKEGATAPGQTYEILDPATGQVTGTGKFKEQSHGFFGDLFGMVGDTLRETAPLWTTAIGLGPLGGMLGGAAASGLGISGLTAAQTAALGSAIAGGASTALQGGDIGDVLKGAVTTALPSFVLPQIPSTGTPAVDAAIKAGAQVAIRGGNVEDAVINSLIGSGIGEATNALELDPKLVNFAIKAAQSEGDPSKLFSAITGLASGAPSSKPTPSEAVGGYGGAETFGFYDPEEEAAVAKDIQNLLIRYSEAQAPAPISFPEFEQPLLTAEEPPAPAFTPAPAPTPMPPMELNRFLEANIEEPATVERLMREYYPELYPESQTITVTGKRLPEQQFYELPEAPSMQVPIEPPPTPAPSPAAPAPAAPAPSPTPAAPAPAPAPAAKKKDDLGLLMALAAAMTPQQQRQDQYQLAQIRNLPEELMYGLRTRG